MNEAVGRNIKAARETANLTQAQLARKIGMDQSEISRIERGTRGLSVNRLGLIAEALGVPAGDLLNDRIAA